MSDGIVPDMPLISRMDAEDAYAIGKEAYSKGDFEGCKLWMHETIRLKEMGRIQGKGPTLFDILDFLAFAEYAVRFVNFLFQALIDVFWSPTWC